LFLTKNLGFDNTSAGAVVMIVTLASVPGAFLGGRLSDQLGRKKAYFLFQGLAGIMIFTCAFISQAQVLIFFLIMSAFFNGGVRPMINALMTDILPVSERQRGFSLAYLGINIGVAIGPVVAGFLFNNYLKLLFIGDAVTTAIAVTLVMLFIPAPEKEALDLGSSLEDVETGSLFTALKKRPLVVVFLTLNILYALTYAQNGFALPITLQHLFGDNGPRNFGFLMSVNAVTCVGLTVVITHMTRHLKSIQTIILGGLAYAVGFGMITVIHSMAMFVVSTIIWTLGEIMVSISFGVYLSHRTPQNFRARFNALTNLSWASGALVGTYFMGIFMDTSGVKAVWPLISVVALLGSVGMALLARTENNLEKAKGSQ
jgi:MFS family permease